MKKLKDHFKIKDFNLPPTQFEQNDLLWGLYTLGFVDVKTKVLIHFDNTARYNV